MSDSAPTPEVSSVQTEVVTLPWRRVHNRGAFYLRQHIQSEVRQVEEMTEHFVRKWFEFPREVCREVCEVVHHGQSGAAFKYTCELTKRMMYYCGFSMKYTIKHNDTRILIVYEWKPLPIVEAERMVKYEDSIMPTKEQIEAQRKQAESLRASTQTAPPPAVASSPVGE